MHFDPSDSFPWNKLDAAQDFLYTIKPWWARFGSRMSFHAIMVPVPPGKRWGGMTSTDQDMNIYVDKNFAINASVEELAGAIEHELQYHVRDTWNRLTWLDDKDVEQYRNICIELEICSSIHRETWMLDEKTVDRILSTSMLFNRRRAEYWSVTKPPSILERAWLPSKIGLPEGLSAEEYYRILKKKENQEEASDDQEEGSDGDGDAGQGDETSQDESEDQPEGNTSDQQGDGQEQDDNQVEGENDASSQQDADESEDQEPGEDQESSGSDEDVADDPSGNEGAPGNDSGEADQDDSETTDSDPSESTDQGEGDPSDSEDSQEGSDDASNDSSEGFDEEADAGADSQDTDGQEGSQEGSQDDQPSDTDESANQPSALEQIQEMKRQDPDLQWWDLDPSQFQEQVEEDDKQEIHEADLKEAEQELAQDVKEQSDILSKGFGLSPGIDIAEWAKGIRVKAGDDCWTEISKLAAHKADSVRIKGSSDLTYLVRNPNQPKFGPVLMGLTTYAPKIYVLMDISASMRRFMETSMSNLKGIMTSVGMRHGSETTWIAADTEVQGVSSSFTFDEQKISERIGRGFGGTVLADIMDDLAHGRFRYEGRRYERPDLLVVSTDCFFTWPWEDRQKPPKGMEVLVLSVNPIDTLEGRITVPEWMVEGKTFVHVDE